MNLGTEIVVVAAATLALFHAPRPLLQRLLRRPAAADAAPAAFRRDVLLDVAATVARLALAVVLVLGLLLSPVEHPAALVMTVGAAYFGSTCIEGIRRYRQREAQRCAVR